MRAEFYKRINVVSVFRKRETVDWYHPRRKQWAGEGEERVLIQINGNKKNGIVNYVKLH